MNVIQPLDLETGYRTFSFRGDNYLVVSTKLYFPLQGGNPIIFPSAYEALSALPTPFIDEGLPKVNPEYLLMGNAQVPNKNPISAMPVHVKIANLDKKLHVTGDRYWTGGLGGTSNPEPFVEMPLTWTQAFGGKEYPANPQGCGIDKKEKYLGEDCVKMPNVEYPRQMLTSLSQRPKPAGFSSLMPDHPDRLKYMGTYNETWLKEDFPGYPKDFSFDALNCAYDDQRFSQELTGGESFSLHGFHHDFTEISGVLPKFKVKSFLVKKGIELADLQESDLEALSPKLDTVVFFPNQLMGMLIYRATVKIDSTDGSDYQYLLSAYEDESTKRSKHDYLNSLVGRIHPELNMRYALTTKDLIPESVPCGMARLMEQDSDPKQLLAEHIEARSQEAYEQGVSDLKEQLEAIIAQQKAQGIDTTMLEQQLKDVGNPTKDEWQLKFEAISDRIAPIDEKTGQVDLVRVDFTAFDDLSKLSEEYAQFQKDKAKLQLANQVEQAKQNGQEEAAKQLSDMTARMDLPPTLPRPATVDDVVANLQAIQQQSPSQDMDIDAIKVKLEAAFKAQVEGYKMGAHLMQKGTPPLADKKTIYQQEVIELIEKRQSLRFLDLAGLDFSNMNLTGVDFSNCHLEQCNFSHANLTDANLDSAIAAHCDFSYANLDNTNLNNANIGASDFKHATINTKQSQSIECGKSDFSYAHISKLDLSDSLNLLEVVFYQTEFNNVCLNDATFIETDFNQTIMKDCELESVTFQQCSLNSSQFKECTLLSCNFIESSINTCQFAFSDLTNSRFLNKSSLKNSTFYHSILADCTLRDINLTHAQFIQCTLLRADFSESDASYSIFDASIGKDALFMKTKLQKANLSNANFMFSNFMQADLVEADLSRGNFYGCEFLGVYVHKTDFSRSILDGTKLEEWRPSKWQ
ncbi:DUF2169 domain-containing protein [Bermanella sp. R86510]|uniref:DUF2169 family type VI secretion system accessory protein n=1 Tax=unclassified Bermanella TaxID=2627862 RepID=UPI0037C9884B